MPTEVQMPDGTILHFPDGVPDSEMQMAAQNYHSQAEQPSGIERNAGLAARAAIKGSTSIPFLVSDLTTKLGNAAIGAYHDLSTPDERAAIDPGARQLPMPSEGLDNLLTSQGLPQPNTPNERIASDVIGAASGAGSSIGIGKATPGAFGEFLSSSPGLQYTGAAAGSGAAGITRENGGSRGQQLAAALLAGIGVPAVGSLVNGAVKGTGRALPTLVEPFKEEGRGRIVGNFLAEQSRNPQAAMANLDNPPVFVPGSYPTTGQASADYGLISLERGLRNSMGAEFADRNVQQNAARNLLLDSIAGDEKAVATAKAARDQVTSELRNKAFENASNVDTAPIIKNIQEMASNPDNAGQTVQNALGWAANQITGKTDPRALYAARKDLGYAMEGKLSGERADLGLARKQLIGVRDTIDQSLEQAAPGFGEYLSKYREMSKPINQMETGQEIRQSTSLAAPDPVTGYQFLSQAKWKNVVDNNKDELAKIMTPDQMAKLNAITADLDRGAAINNPAIRPLGSDTMQNLTTAHVVGAFLGNHPATPAINSLVRPLAWLYSLPERATQQLLVDAMLDPSLARGLMSQATPKNVIDLSNELKRRAMAITVGDTAAITQQSQNPNK